MNIISTSRKLKEYPKTGVGALRRPTPVFGLPLIFSWSTDYSIQIKKVKKGWIWCYNSSRIKDMQKTKPSEILAVQFGISRESARYFLIRVQKSFKTEKPPHQLILAFMNAQNFASLPTPHHVAARMQESGVWVHPLNAAPPEPFDEEELYGE